MSLISITIWVKESIFTFILVCRRLAWGSSSFYLQSVSISLMLAIFVPCDWPDGSHFIDCALLLNDPQSDSTTSTWRVFFPHGLHGWPSCSWTNQFTVIFNYLHLSHSSSVLWQMIFHTSTWLMFWIKHLFSFLSLFVSITLLWELKKVTKSEWGIIEMEWTATFPKSKQNKMSWARLHSEGRISSRGSHDEWDHLDLMIVMVMVDLRCKSHGLGTQ